MANEVTLGGDRLGSGNKQKVELHNYQMTSFNLEQDWKSSMAPGILYPFLKLVGTNHDTFDIDLDSFVRTLPTKGPLFGSYKLQVDIFQAPWRLYQGILHNNPIDIGLKMNKVYLPKIKYTTIDGEFAPKAEGSDKFNYQVNESALMKYMGFSGAGCTDMYAATRDFTIIDRKINAIPFLAYYDIFKNYYSNKQEENAYVITPRIIEGEKTHIKSVQHLDSLFNNPIYFPENTDQYNTTIPNIQGQEEPFLPGFTWSSENNVELNIITNIKDYNNLKFDFYDEITTETTELSFKELIETINNQYPLIALEHNINEDPQYPAWHPVPNRYVILLYPQNIKEAIGHNFTQVTLYINQDFLEDINDINLTPFKLENIDIMRNRLLSSNELGNEFVIDDREELMPYAALTKRTENEISWNAFPQNGLVVKTYQSDLFNNWLDTEWIDGENGISALSAVSVVNDKFTMDSLNLAEKVYEVLNRIAVSGGTYEDWQEAVWGQGAIRKAETPMYMGGMAAEIMFEEVISSSETNVKGDYQPLGSLGGKGTQVSKRGGNNIHIKCEEPSYIIGIVSLTPRICYTQGNDWDLTDIDTLDDLHKPALDGIGFQDLMTEQMAWWDTQVIVTPGEPTEYYRKSAGKQTAWINYQTAVDKAYGDFAKAESKNFMVLSRNYEIYQPETISGNPGNPELKDLTTYIDPRKFNYAFAYTDLAAQNFWVQIHSKVIARRKMGAQQIPNL